MRDLFRWWWDHRGPWMLGDALLLLIGTWVVVTLIWLRLT
jgi:hypothetical protein